MKMNRKRFRFSMAILWGLAAIIQFCVGEIYAGAISIFVSIAYFIKMKKGDKEDARNL